MVGRTSLCGCMPRRRRVPGYRREPTNPVARSPRLGTRLVAPRVAAYRNDLQKESTYRSQDPVDPARAAHCRQSRTGRQHVRVARSVLEPSHEHAQPLCCDHRRASAALDATRRDATRRDVPDALARHSPATGGAERTETPVPIEQQVNACDPANTATTVVSYGRALRGGRHEDLRAKWRRPTNLLVCRV